MTTVRCVSCTAIVDDRWVTCPECGEDPRTGGTPRPCKNCGAALVSDASFCVTCGAAVGEEKPEEPRVTAVARCPQCGHLGRPTDQFCSECGTQTVEDQVPEEEATWSLPGPSRGMTAGGENRQPGVLPTPGMAIAGFICSLLGLVLPFLGFLGLILSAISLGNANETGAPKGLAIAGVVLGIIAVVSGLLFLATW